MDALEIQPIEGPLNADVTVPGSKSITNRALLVAALAEGESSLTGALFSEDTDHMADALRALGIHVDANPGRSSFAIRGAGGRIPALRADLYAGNSGTAARFLTAAVGLGQGTYTLDGTPRMRERPIQDLLDGLRSLGVNAYSKEGNGCPPVVVEASGIRGGPTVMPGSRSSQYFTALLLAAPYAEKDVDIRVEGDLVSKPYIDITISVMRAFGVEVRNDGYARFVVGAGQRYRAQDYLIEPDASNASYFLAAAALCGGRVRVHGLSPASAQGDARFADVLERMGCEVHKDADGIEVVGPERLTGIDVDMNAMPDMVLTLAPIAPFASGPVAIRNVANLRIKETDRISALATELQKLGVRVEAREDGLTVHPTDRLGSGELDTYDDHRMAMGLSLIGLAAPGIVIRNPECVAKTFPGFFEHLEALH
jgi:3-phosphoshikimate 1-carboxyvinyltransferase